MHDVVNDDARYRLLIDAITDYAIYMLDPAGIVTSWNPGAERFKGYQAREIVGKHFSNFYTPEEREAGVPKLALEIAADEGRFEREGWRLRKNGERFWAHVIIDPIRSPEGELIGYAKITRDLTERKFAEESLKASEEQFRRLVQGVTDYAIYMLDPTGKVISWNPGAERIKGYEPDEIIGQHFSRFYSDDDRNGGLPDRGLSTAAREGRFESEGWRVRKDGTRFWANVVIDAIKGDDGEVIGFAKITRDITERRETQQALEQAQQALFQSQKLESIGQLTGGIAHDFNNLLMAILGSLELMRKRLPEDPKLLSLLDNAKQAASRGSALTQRMLAFARRQDLKREAVNVPELVDGIHGLLDRAGGPMVAIRTELPADLPPVATDANQLESALLNLTVNARDAMPEGGQITISGRAETLGDVHPTALPPGRYVAISVRDTGHGMDEVTAARATEPFFTTKGVGKGTGLGLSMVHGLVEQSGGRFMLESKPGHGATVTVWLPVAHGTLPLADLAADAAPAPSRATRQSVILTVDDDALVLMNTVAMLEDMGHRVIEAGSGDEALKLIEHEAQIDLVVSDQAMPGMTGVQLAEEIRRLRPDMPVVLATGYAELPPGADASFLRLAKPFTQAQLAEAVAMARGPENAG